MEWRAFDLRPDMPPEGMPSPYASPDRVSRSEGTRKMFEEAGLKYTTRTWLSNSKPALQASEYAKEKGKFKEFHKAVFEAYFGEGKDIGSVDILSDIAQSVGLDLQEMRLALERETYRDMVEEQFEEARALGITAIPTFVFGDRAVVGAYPYAVFRRVMAMVQREQGIGEDATP